MVLVWSGFRIGPAYDETHSCGYVPVSLYGKDVKRFSSGADYIFFAECYGVAVPADIYAWAINYMLTCN